MGILVLVILSGFTYKYLTHNSSESASDKKIKTSDKVIYTSEQEIKQAQERNGIPFKRGSVDASNLEYYWLNATVVDGSFDCYIFNSQTHQIYGSTYTTAGFGTPSTSGRTYYHNQDYDMGFINETIDSVCDNSF